MEQGQKFKQIRKQKIHYSETRSVAGSVASLSDFENNKHHSQMILFFKLLKHLKVRYNEFSNRISYGQKPT